MAGSASSSRLGARSRVLLVGLDAGGIGWLQGALGDSVEMQSGSISDVARVRPHVLIVESAAVLDELGATGALGGVVTMMLVAGAREAAALPEHEAVYFVLSLDMSPGDARAIVASALEQRPAVGAPPTVEDAARLQRLLEVPRRFAGERSLRGAAAVATNACVELIGADRADCFFYDADEGSLWTEGSGDARWQGGREATARHGLAGFAARTGRPVCAARASDDPRYRREVDDPAGKGNERLLAQPVAGADGQVHAVLVAVRESHGEPFSAEDERLAAWLAAQLGPLTGQLAMRVEASSVLEEAAEAEDRIYRREATAARARSGARGDVVRVSPAWVSWTYWLLVAMLSAAVIFVVVARVNEYSSGPAVVYQTDRSDVTAPVSGNLVALHISAGADVAAGQLIASFHSSDESTQLARLEREWETSLRAYLSNQSDLGARAAIASLRAQRDRSLEKLSVRADRTGVVGDLRVVVGQSVTAGQPIASIVRAGSRLEIVALLPGGDGPRLTRGMRLRLRPAGYPGVAEDLEVEAVGREVIGPDEARRLLGSQLGDALAIAGPMVVVRAELPPTFEARGETFDFVHGMQGSAEVRLRSKSVIETLVPGLGEL